MPKRSLLTISIDTEPDCSSTWHYSSPLSFQGVTEGVVSILQPLFNAHRARPTYLVSNVVLEDEASVDALGSLDGDFELGAHLHGDFIEPERTYTNYAGKKGEENQCFYEPSIEMQKLQSLTARFTSCFGYRPTSFRAGRFSAGAHTIKCLSELGYLVDSSVTPGICWADPTREAPIDFTRAGNQPYRVSAKSIVEPDERGEILEVPITIARMWRRLRRQHVWLRPGMSTIRQMKRLVRRVGSGRDFGTTVYNLMFHNVEVAPGKSPYAQTPSDVRRYVQRLDEFLNFCDEQRFKYVTLSELASELKVNEGLIGEAT